VNTGLFFTNFRDSYQWPRDCNFSAKPGSLNVLGVISFILLLCLTPGAIAADNAPDKSRLLTAVVLNDFPPLYSRSKEGRPIGFAIDILEHVSRNSNLTIRYLAAENWSEAMQAIRTGKADIIPGIGISPVRSEEFLFTRQIETIPVSLFVRASNQAISGLESLSGNKIGVIGESAAETRLKALQVNTLISFPNIESALFQLMSGAIDVFVFPEPVLKQKMRMIDIGPERINVVGKPLMELKRGFLLRKTDQDLVELLNPAIHAYTQSSEYLSNYQKWYGQPIPFWTVKRISWSMAAALIVIAAGLLGWRYYSISCLNRKLQESETRLSTLINSMPDLVWLKTPEGVYQFCNSRFELFFGAKEPEIMGKTDYDFVDKELADFFREKDKAAILANAPSKNGASDFCR